MMIYDFSEELEKIIKSLKRKDPETHKAIKNKIREVINSDPEHYKPLKYGMKNLKRVHIRKSFVLVFEYHIEQELIHFLDYDHHDKIYKKYR